MPIQQGNGMARKRIGILTGGGDVPGLNAIIKTVTYRGSEDDIEIVAAQIGRRQHVQHGALPSALFQQAGTADLSQPRVIGFGW